jgi:hypothetical protein
MRRGGAGRGSDQASRMLPAWQVKPVSYARTQGAAAAHSFHNIFCSDAVRFVCYLSARDDANVC